MITDKTSRIVWHDLFTADRARSMSFYERLAGWNYEVEHAADFAWGGGEKDFVLALLDDEAGAGFVDTPESLDDGWVPYIEVSDVDVVAARAVELGGAVVKPPFEVPGVGRNALLSDPLGASVGISVSQHNFPVPERQFGTELYLSTGSAFPEEFYAGLAGWEPSPGDGKAGGFVVKAPSGDEVALHLESGIRLNSRGVWLPRIKVTALDVSMSEAMALGAIAVGGLPTLAHNSSSATLRDPNGALFSLLEKDA